MKVAILAAGLGSRLHPLTINRPKAMVGLHGKPLVQHQAESLLESGFSYEDIYIVGGYKIEQIEDHFRGTGVHLIYNPFYDSMNNIYSFMLTQAVGDDLLLMNSDLHCDRRILGRVLESPFSTCIAVDRQREITEEAMKVKLNGDRLLSVNKRMSPAEADGEYIGLAKLASDDLVVLYRKARQLIDAGETNEWYESVFEACAEVVPIRVVDTAGFPWIEIDDMSDFEKAEA
ncbi:NTP transferase domain-containing protein [Cohnella sp. CFH 77786]|uniref:phosphocholine cytidylyltransferase family protein n=1 Tax=Cohnella sp. CFH 77786 TaxID=2662265 RepID=UPI001C609D27|nr:phosphocholine cytidylyltransferase family protein [Cohnella sp. CFH 77786]MBW5445362.1 NTP transferase domain-containing protein [Cohnella sp. CFH 77786]